MANASSGAQSGDVLRREAIHRDNVELGRVGEHHQIARTPPYPASPSTPARRSRVRTQCRFPRHRLRSAQSGSGIRWNRPTVLLIMRQQDQRRQRQRHARRRPPRRRRSSRARRARHPAGQSGQPQCRQPELFCPSTPRRHTNGRTASCTMARVQVAIRAPPSVICLPERHLPAPACPATTLVAGAARPSAIDRRHFRLV